MEDKANKLFIGGLNRNTTEDTLRQHFEKYGQIIDLVIITDQQTRTSRGFGFVTYAERDSTMGALQDRPHNLDGKSLEVKRSIPRDIQSETAQLKTVEGFVGGLSTSTTEEALRSYIETNYIKATNCPVTIKKLEIKKKRDTNESRGFAFITFGQEDDLDFILIEDPKPFIGGRKVEIKKAAPKDGSGDFGGRGGGRGRGASRGGGGGRGRGRGGYDQGATQQYGNGYNSNYSSGGYDNSGGGYGSGGYSDNAYSNTGYGSTASYGNGYSNYGQSATGYDTGSGYEQQSYYQDTSSGYGGGADSGYGGGRGKPRGAGGRGAGRGGGGGRGRGRFQPY